MSKGSLIQNQGELLRAIQKETLRLLGEQGRLLDGLDAAEVSLGQDSIKLRGDLANEREKVENLTMTVAVVGTMKAGKSTLLNAIIGDEILPSRETGMTAMPLVISHEAGLSEPVLHIKHVDAFNRAAVSFKNKLNEIIVKKGSEAADEVLQVVGPLDAAFLHEHFVDGDGWQFADVTKGTSQIRECLQVMNDLLRLSTKDGIDIPSPLEGMATYADIPELRIHFSRFTAENSQVSIGKLAFIDTPGPNEAAQQHLKAIVDEQLKRASAIILVLNFTQLNTQEAADFQTQVLDLVVNHQEQIHVVVNRYDEKDHHGMSIEGLRDYVTDSLCRRAGLPRDRVLPVSARQALLAIRALDILNKGDALPDPKEAPWVESFGNVLMGMDWEEDINDSTRVRRCAERGLEKSRFSSVTTGVVEHAFANSASGSLRSALGKLCDFVAHDSLVADALRANVGALNADIVKLREAANSVKSWMEQLEIIRDKALRLIGEAIKEWIESIDAERIVLIERLKVSKWVEDGVEVKRKVRVPLLHRSLGDLWRQACLKLKEMNGREFPESDRPEFEKQTEAAMEKVRAYAAEEIESFCSRVNESSRNGQAKLYSTIDSKLEPLRVQLQRMLRDDFEIKTTLPEFRMLTGLTGEFDAKTVTEKKDYVVEEERRKRPWYLLWLMEITYKVKIEKTAFKLDLSKLESELEKIVARIIDEARLDFEGRTKSNMDDYWKQLEQRMRLFYDALSQQKEDVMNDAIKKGERVSTLRSLDTRRSKIEEEARQNYGALGSDVSR